MSQLNILYIDPQEIKPETINLISGFIRISNYLHSKKDKLKGSFQEDFLKLDFENLPPFLPKNIIEYRNALKKKLEKIYSQFPFNVAAISCYSSHHYINTLELASIIKYKINSNCLIVVGGPHASICPEDFYHYNFPSYLKSQRQKDATPIDYIVKGEGEIPFYRLIKSILNGTIKKRKNLSSKCIVLKSEILEDLSQLPLINYDLYQKYAKEIEALGRIIIDLMRGCPFRCNICPNGANFLPCYKNVRYKPIEKCLQELSRIIEFDWLKVNDVWISDATFFPKRKLREEFYEGLKRIKNLEGDLPFRLLIWDRVDTCHLKKDLERFARFNIESYIGMESVSPKLLRIMGKIGNKPKGKKRNNTHHYIKKVEDLMIKSNKINASLVFGLVIGCPGSSLESFTDHKNFFLKKRFSGNSLVDKYDVNLRFTKYFPLVGEKLYYQCESKYNTKVYYKEWWREFTKDQRILAGLVDPTKTFSLKKSLDLNYTLIREIFRSQISRNNKYYSIKRLLNIKMYYERIKQKIPKETYPIKI